MYVQFVPMLFQIPVTPLSDWPSPSERNNTCVNVAEKVSGRSDGEKVGL